MPKGVYTRKKQDPFERFMSFVEKQKNGCWLWTGYKSHGYGRFLYERKLWLAYKWLYEQVNGNKKPNMDLDHTCRNRACVNPDHLEQVTRSENIKRGMAGEKTRERSKTVTHCPHGHEYSAANTSMTKAGTRRCKACARNRASRYRQRRKKLD